MKNFANRFLDTDGLFAPAAISLAILSFVIRFIALNQTAYGNGWDSYFYMEQIQSLHDTGKMHSSEWTLFYPILLLIKLFIPDYVLVVKIASALLASVFTWTVFVVSTKITKSNYATLVATSFIVFSPELTYFCSQWPKNLLGIILLLMLLGALWTNNKKWIFVFLILGFFGHRMTALLGVGVVAFAAVRKHIPLKVWLGFMLISFILLMATFFIPGIINAKDIERINNLIAFSPEFPILAFYQIFNTDKIHPAWHFELWFTGMVACLVLRHAIRQKSEPSIVLSVLFVILWLPFYQWDMAGAAYRFFHAGILLTPLMTAVIVPDKKTWVKYAIPVLLVLALVTWKSYDPSRHDPPYDFYERVTKQTQKRFAELQVSPELVIAHKSLSEFYSFTTKTDAMAWVPEYKIDDRKLWRIAVLPYPKLWEYYLKEQPIHLTGTYYLVQESQWENFITILHQQESPELLAEHLTWKNPNTVRPAFLKKKS